jgi:hypothetical protein
MTANVKLLILVDGHEVVPRPLHTDDEFGSCDGCEIEDTENASSICLHLCEQDGGNGYMRKEHTSKVKIRLAAGWRLVSMFYRIRGDGYMLTAFTRKQAMETMESLGLKDPKLCVVRGWSRKKFAK